ncbi:MAG TPA: phytanoyl-CoA dioxygenase family protein [Pirellulales bacterium]|nr:phytanoyl-CoA dioxygenase family protein [Pirellulales bacterium]
MQDAIERTGFAIVENVLDAQEATALAESVERRWPREPGTDRSGTYARRDLLALPEVARLANSSSLRRLVEPVLGPMAFAVRGLWFDKVPGANWKVVWHQDLTIAVRERVEVPRYRAWSLKGGVPHVQAPAELLARMLTVRLHLDDCGDADGPLRVISGSHRAGRLSDDEIMQRSKERIETVCRVGRGGALLMRPLLLHASSAATTPSHRRVIHIEYAAQDLPGGLEWHVRVGKGDGTQANHR